MRKTATRFVASATTLALVIGLCPAAAIAAEPSDAGVAPQQMLTIGNMAGQSAESDFTTEASGSGVAITGYVGEGGEVAIPETIDGKSVVAINEAAFYGKTEITSVSIPSCVKSIGTGAFANCSGIQSLTLANGLETIGDYAFQGTAIASVAIPASVTSVGSATNNGWSPFYSCANLNQVNVASGNKTYKAVDNVLYNTAGDTLLFYPAGKTDTNFTIPSAVTTVGPQSFYQNSHINQVTIPASVTELGDWCFCQTALTAATVPATVKKLGSGVFDNCHELKSLDYETTAAQPYRLCENCSSLARVTLPSGLKSIGFRAFNWCSAITSITIPDSVETIESTAFYKCTGLTSITIPASVKLIDDSAFCYCRNLANVYGCAGVERINMYAFAYTGISSFPWNAKLRYVSGSAFQGCDGFANPDFPSYLTKSGGGDYRVYDDTIKVSGTVDYTKAAEVLAIVNKERAAEGLDPLVMDKTLQAAAMQRSAELALLFEHTRPDGDNCFAAAASMSGENIAAGSSTAEGVMDQWMNSPGHRANILTANFKSIGIGCIQVGAITYWVQAFGYDDGSNSQAGSGTANATYGVNVDYGTVSFDGGGFNLNMALGDPEVIEPGASLELQVGIPNAGWSWVYCPTDPTSFTWTSSDPSIAHVSARGVVTPGTKRGIATITATSMGGKSWSIRVSIGSSIENAQLSGIANATYAGKAITQPKLVVKLGGTTLKAGTDYSVSYKDNKNAGTATIVVTGKGNYTGTAQATFTIAKAKNTLKAKGRTAKAKAAKLKKKAQAIKKTKAMTVSKAQGKVTCKLTKISCKKALKSQAKKKIKVAKSGKITLKKGLKAGTYKLKIKVSAKGNANYKSGAKTIAVKVTVK